MKHSAVGDRVLKSGGGGTEGAVEVGGREQLQVGSTDKKMPGGMTPSGRHCKRGRAARTENPSRHSGLGLENGLTAGEIAHGQGVSTGPFSLEHHLSW